MFWTCNGTFQAKMAAAVPVIKFITSSLCLLKTQFIILNVYYLICGVKWRQPINYPVLMKIIFLYKFDE